MSFEIIDNTFQVIVLAAMALLAFILAFRRSSRSCLILAFGYASFMMGTLYYLLHLIILAMGRRCFMWPNAPGWPRISFFSRWRSSIGRACVRRSPFGAGSWGGLCRSCHAGAGVWPLSADVRCAGAHLWHAGLPLFFGLQKEKRLRPYEIALLFEMSLQILLFVVSGFIRDYTRFSLYYAVDILLTLTLVSFLPRILQEEPHDLH